jgi:transcriptional regulator of heat shock response
MFLGEKQKFVFYNLARSCIDKREPIGSKLLAKKIKNKLSPPMLRIYLRRLVSAGYVENAPRFLGRLPTSKGWYVYIKKFKLKPEKKIPSKFNPDCLLDELASFTRNVVFSNDSVVSRFVVKGLKYIIEDIRENEVAEDILNIVEKLDSLFEEFNDEKIKIFIGDRFYLSQSKKVSLIGYRRGDFIVGFLGHQINCYHTNVTLLKKILATNERYSKSKQ